MVQPLVQSGIILFLLLVLLPLVPLVCLFVIVPFVFCLLFIILCVTIWYPLGWYSLSLSVLLPGIL
jgi:hypothetical protein